MHPLDGFNADAFAFGKLLRSDLAGLRGALVAVALVEFDAALSVVAHPFAVVSVGFSKGAAVCLPLPRANKVALLLAGELAGDFVITHATLDEVRFAFAVCWCR